MVRCLVVERRFTTQERCQLWNASRKKHSFFAQEVKARWRGSKHLFARRHRDPDLWVVEIEDAHGRAFLDGDLAKPQSPELTEAEAAAKALFRGR